MFPVPFIVGSSQSHLDHLDLTVYLNQIGRRQVELVGHQAEAGT